MFGVTRIIWHALLWALSLTIIPGAAGWHLLRRRPLRRIRGIQASAEAIVAGDLTHRLPLSNRRDELDMLAAIVNAMLDRIEKLMNEVKGATTSPTTCAPRSPACAPSFTRISATSRGRLARRGAYIAIAETSMTPMARFRGLLRISELEDHRRSGFHGPAAAAARTA